jgi:hypothetical protein
MKGAEHAIRGRDHRPNGEAHTIFMHALQVTLGSIGLRRPKVSKETYYRAKETYYVPTFEHLPARLGVLLGRGPCNCFPGKKEKGKKEKGRVVR